MGQRYWVHRDIYVCPVENWAVILDLRTQAYFGLSANQFEVLRTSVEGVASDSSSFQADASDIAEAMVSRGLLTRDARFGKSLQFAWLSCARAVPFRGRLQSLGLDASGSDSRILLRHLVSFFFAVVYAAFLLRCVSFGRIVRRIESRKRHAVPRTTAADEQKIIELAQIYRRLRPLIYTAEGHCLFDSLALVLFLRAFGMFPTWAIGLQTKPFLAHSWVQQGDLVLNDTLQKVQEFAPILAI